MVHALPEPRGGHGFESSTEEIGKPNLGSLNRRVCLSHITMKSLSSMTLDKEKELLSRTVDDIAERQVMYFRSTDAILH